MVEYLLVSKRDYLIHIGKEKNKQYADHIFVMIFR